MLSFTLSICWDAGSSSAQELALNFWDDRDAKASLVKFLESVTGPQNDQFVAETDRIAVFDSDGTLRPENPLPFQLCLQWMN